MLLVNIKIKIKYFSWSIEDIEKVINNHWKFWNSSKYKDYISTVYSSGTMNGDSNGSFW